MVLGGDAAVIDGEAADLDGDAAVLGAEVVLGEGRGGEGGRDGWGRSGDETRL